MKDKRKDGVEVEHTEHGMVIHLPDFTALRMKETAEFRAEVRKPDRLECSHFRTGVALDAEQRRAHCVKCNASLDPFDALLRMAEEHDRIRADFTRAREETRDTHLRLAVLERLEKNVRERLKRLGVNADDGFWQRNLSQVLKSLVEQIRREQLLEAKKGAGA